MGEKWRHQGAVGANQTYTRFAKCAYSGNKKSYELPHKYWNEDIKARLNDRFMRDDCMCETCVEHREHLVKLRAALERTNDRAGLKAMGW